MTKNAELKNKMGRSATGFKFRQSLSTIIILVVLFAVASLMASPASMQVSQGNNPPKTEVLQGRRAVANEVLVKFNDSASVGSIAQAAQDGDVDSDDEVGGTGVRLFHSRSKDVTTLLGELRARSDVAYAEPNYIVHADLIPNDSSFTSLWGLRNTGQVINGVAGTPGADISATLAWDISTGSRSNVVAVVDTGIDYTHPDLAANVWSAPTSFTVVVGGRSITCAAGTHGFNAITNTCDPRDDNNHGSHVSGTIGGVGGNGVGVAGVNWTASIMGTKFLDASGSGTTANAINAIEFAIQAKLVLGASANVRVLSNSWGGGGFSQALLDEINKANTNNMLFTAAAGNNGTNNDTTAFYPANYNAPNIVAVAATDNRDQRASFSNFGRTTVHLGAPGVDVLSTTIGNTYSFFSGTSMATPHVSGAAALVLSVCSLDTAALKSNLLANVDPISSMSTSTISGGRLNVNKAIRACSLPPTPDFSLSTTPASVTVAPGATASYTENITRTGGFTGAVTLSISGLPAGAAATFTPNPATGASSALSVTTSSTTPAGSYVFTVTGTSGALTRTSTATLVVQAPGTGNFTLALTPTSRSINPGTSTTYTVNITRSGGFTGSVTFSVSGLGTGANGTFSPNPATANSSTLTVTTTTSATPGSRVFTVTGTSGALTRTATGTLVIKNCVNGQGDC